MPGVRPRNRLAAAPLPRQFDRLLAELYADARSLGADAARAPVDVYLCDEPPALMVELDAAGIDPDAIEILLHDDVLTVRGERRRPTGRRMYHHAEIAWGPFERRLRLNLPVDADRGAAAYDRGILTITLPLAERPAPERVTIVVRQRRAGG